jgi:hypothetical protein
MTLKKNYTDDNKQIVTVFKKGEEGWQKQLIKCKKLNLK